MDADKKLKAGTLLAFQLSATNGDDMAISHLLKDTFTEYPETWPHIVNAALVVMHKAVIPGFLSALDEHIVMPDGSTPGEIFKDCVREMIAGYITEAD